MVTENLEPLAKFLIRRAQLKGPYELLGHMNMGERLLRRIDWHIMANRAIARPTLLKPALTENQIDPRLVYAQPGQWVLPDDSGILTVNQDQHYRRQNQLLVKYRQPRNFLPSWEQQLQSAATPNVQPFADHMNLKPRNCNGQLNPSLQGPVSANTASLLKRDPESAEIPIADIAHLRGKDWAKMAQQRAREFSRLSQHDKAEKIMQLHKTQAAQGPSKLHHPPPLHQQQPHAQLTNHDRPYQTSSFANHPGFSNVRVTFPNTQYIAGLNPSEAQTQKNGVDMTGLPFGIDPK